MKAPRKKTAPPDLEMDLGRRRRRGLWLAAGSVMLAGVTGAADNNFGDLSIEQLMSETITSVAKKEQRRGDAAAAITLLSNDDLQRSGVTSVAEAMRLVPGMNVGSASASQWAISARGFNGAYANKLLVLVDGRTVYTPLFAGVYWDLQQQMLMDLDRIEVIRGPGGTLWGANAVNGVINVVSRSARETQGTAVYAGGGDVHQALAGGRVGAQLGADTYFRVFGSYQYTSQYPNSQGSYPASGPNNDRWDSWHSGFRLDHYLDDDTQVTWQGDVTSANLDARTSDAYNANTVARWSQALDVDSRLEFQIYVDRTYRSDYARAGTTTDTLDATVQHTWGVTERNEVVWGAGYRYLNLLAEPTAPWVQLLDRQFDRHLVSAFLQNEFKLIPDRLSVTAGTKVEHNEMTDWEYQPSVRAMFKPTPQQTIWGSVSRTVRTPSEFEGSRLAQVPLTGPIINPGDGLPYLPVLAGNPNLAAEKQWAYELGYRCQPTVWLNFEVNGFYNDYEDLIAGGVITSYQPGAPIGLALAPFDNYQSAEAYGGETTITVTPRKSWRLTVNYSLLLGDVSTVAGQLRGYSNQVRSGARNQVLLRSAHDLTARCAFDVQARYVDNVAGTPGFRQPGSYLTADVRISYRPSEAWELSVVGQNLLDRAHYEQGNEPLVITGEVPRGVYAKVTWKY